jgi:outer membrane protein assembly factor BamB
VALVGDGSNSTPVVWGDRLYYQSAIKTDRLGAAAATEETGRRRFGGRPPKNIYRFNLVCRDRHSGALLWSKTIAETLPHEGHHGDHGFVSFSPVTDGKHIWASFGSRGLYCFDMEGAERWRVELGPYNIRAQFGEGGSPTLAGDLIVVVKDHEGDSFIAAYNKQTGQQIWQKDRDERSNWTTPFAVDVNGQTQIVVNGTTRIYGYEAWTGAILWECTGQTMNIVPTPVIADDLVFCASGFRGNKLQAIRLGKTGDLTGTEAIAWELNEDTPYVPSPLAYEGRLYVCSGNREIISCYEAATGKPHYTRQSLPELKGIYASPVGVAGRVYFVGRNGVACVLKNSDSFEILATNSLDDDIDCSPVVIGDTLYLKGKKHLYCIAAGS